MSGQQQLNEIMRELKGLRDDVNKLLTRAGEQTTSNMDAMAVAQRKRLELAEERAKADRAEFEAELATTDRTPMTAYGKARLASVDPPRITVDEGLLLDEAERLGDEGSVA